MIEFLLKSTSALIVFMLSYYLLLSRTSSFKFNRYFLLFSLLVAMVFPIVKLPHPIAPNLLQVDEVFYTESAIYENIPEDPITESTDLKIRSSKKANLLAILNLFYMVVTTVLLIRYLRNLYLLLVMSNKKGVKYYQNAKLIFVEKKIIPFSFLNTIYINRQDYKKGLIDSDLLNHEVAHSKQLHSIDILFIELLQVFYWFNPLIFLFKKAIKTNHEYLADNFVIENCDDALKYTNKLINFSFRDNCMNLASGFDYLLIKKRIIMMTKNSKKVSKLKLSIILSIILLALYAFTSSKSQELLLNNTSPTSAINTEIINSDGEILIEALIDGNTELHVFKNGLMWFSKGVAKPGKHHSKNEPTWINGKEWMPQWGEPTQARGFDITGLYEMEIGDLDSYRLKLISIGLEKGKANSEMRDPISLVTLVDRLIVNIPDTQGDSRWYKFKLYQ